MKEEKIIDLAISIGETLKDNGVDNINDIFNVVGTFVIQTTYSLITQNPQLRPEINTARWLDAVKKQILTNADEIRKIGLPPDMMAN